MPNVEIHQKSLLFKFLDLKCQQHEVKGLFWKEIFLALRSVDNGEEVASCIPQAECSFYRECQLALKDFIRLRKASPTPTVVPQGVISCVSAGQGAALEIL